MTPIIQASITRIEDIPSLSELPPQQIEFLVDGYIARSSVTLVCGEAGAGKSTWSLALAGAISKGKPFAGLKAQQAPVLYLDRENPQPIAQQRLRDQNLSTGELFRYWGSWIEPEPVLLSDRMVHDYVKSCEVKPLIVLDSLAAFNVTDENSVKDIRDFMKPARQLANLGASVVVIHHSGKADTAQLFRGSSAIKDSVDVAFRVLNSNTNKRLERLKLEAFKMRYLVTPTQDFHYVDGRFTSDQAPAVGDQLRELLHDNPGTTQTSFQRKAMKLGIKREPIRQFLAECADIERSDGPKNSTLYKLKVSASPVMSLSDASKAA